MKKMLLTVAGHQIQINSFNAELDANFKNLYAAYFGSGTCEWDKLNMAAKCFFQQNWGRREFNKAHDDYFGNFIPIWEQFFLSRRFSEAENIWRQALTPALELVGEMGCDGIHKGTPYYFSGMTAIIRGNLEQGFLLMHQAYEEDRATFDTKIPNNPALAFVTLDFGNERQAFRDWVLDHARFLESSINAYVALYNREFSLDSFRRHFLSPEDNIERAIYFVYILARIKTLWEIREQPGRVLRSDFAGELVMDVLFGLIRGIEDSIVNRNPNNSNGMYGAQVKYLAESAGCSFSTSLTGIYDFKEKDLDDFLTERLAIHRGNIVQDKQTDILITYAIRNNAGHMIVPSKIVRDYFETIIQACLNV
ncbi:MAG: hypothetical protein PHR28_06415, partial [candidate division Zixibacteria bacterium]|nr:hypothetical protein [candidate division Zixibacteria bacterium]